MHGVHDDDDGQTPIKSTIHHRSMDRQGIHILEEENKDAVGGGCRRNGIRILEEENKDAARMHAASTASCRGHGDCGLPGWSGGRRAVTGQRRYVIDCACRRHLLAEWHAMAAALAWRVARPAGHLASGI
jgi:hypothetical protein